MIGEIRLEKNKIAAYIFSSIDNKEIVEQDKNRIIKYAKEKLDANETDINFFVDTGPRESRTKIIELMDKIRNKEFNILLLNHMSQLYKVRNQQEMNEAMQTISMITLQGVKIISILEEEMMQ